MHRDGYIAWYDSARVGATLYNPRHGTFYTYDNPAAVAAKTAYIKKHKLGGAYVWALNDDDAGASLTKAIAAGRQVIETVLRSPKSSAIGKRSMSGFTWAIPLIALSVKH